MLSFYTDGRLYAIPNSASMYTMGSLNLNYIPSVIAVIAYRGDTDVTFGTLASDSAGYVTDAGWKCTQYFHADWMLPEFDDSAWPAALTKTQNGDESTSP